MQRVLVPLLQAGALTYGVVGLLKIGVGRQWPNGGADPSAADRLEHPERARDFTPFQRGVGAWPSGHTAVMFAFAAAFRASNPRLGWLSFAGYPLAVGVAGGMWFGDHHWASDIVSGALLGEAIGGSVGQSFSAGARRAGHAGGFAHRRRGLLRHSGSRSGEAARVGAQTITKSSVSVASSAAI